MKQQVLILEQVDKKILLLKKVEDLSIPSTGWIKAIRKALGMSLRQLGEMMGITAQSVKEIEEREMNSTISLKVLKQFGRAMNMKLVYGFIPSGETLDDMISRRALDIAKEIVQRTSASMKLEDQENDPERIERAINEKARKIKDEMPKYLWDRTTI